MNSEKLYIKGFNNGYILAQYKPELLNIISQNLPLKNDYLKGFFAGVGEYGFKINKDQLLELQRLRGQSHERDIGSSRE